MGWCRFGTAGAAAFLSAVTVAGTAAPASATTSSRVQPNTRRQALSAMHGEAFAYASYEAYAAEAARRGYTSAARAYRHAALVERDDHFASLARLIGLVGSDAANLRDSIAGETYESRTMYPRFAATARAAGNTAAARLFTEIARDEAGHARAYRTALRALTRPGSARVPVGPGYDAVAIVRSRRQASGATLRDLRTAMHGEAFAYAKYRLFARHARRTGQPALARLFDKAAATELRDHFAHEALLAGLVGATRTNLRASVAGERYESRTMYPRYGRQAARAGDTAVSRLFMEIARDEAGHARAFSAALTRRR